MSRESQHVTNRILVPPVTSTTVGSRAFPVAAPLIWNALYPTTLSQLSRCQPSRESWKDVYSVNRFLAFVTGIYTCSGPCSGSATYATLKIPWLIDWLMDWLIDWCQTRQLVVLLIREAATGWWRQWKNVENDYRAKQHDVERENWLPAVRALAARCRCDALM